MSEDGVFRKIWVQLIRLDITDEDKRPNTKLVKCIHLREDHGCDEVRAKFCETFQISDAGRVLKLRNHRGSLIPIKGNIPVNSRSVPYILEIVNIYQNVKPQEKSIRISDQSEGVKKRFQDIITRIKNIECATPDLSNKRNERMNSEINELENKLMFLQKRLNEAEVSQWKGMFKKYPLW